MTTIAEALRTAQRHFQAGDLRQAELFYRQILQVNPSQTAALHWLGVIAHQAGRPEVAVQYMTQLVALVPLNAGLHYNLGSAWQALGKLDEAIASYREALRLQPDYADAHNNLGSALAAQGKLDEATASYQRALAINPNCAAAHCNLASSLKQQGKRDEAIGCYQRALLLNPDNFSVHLNLGAVLVEQHRLEQALVHFREAMRLNPRHALVHNNLGNALRMLGRLEEAAASYGQALRLQPGLAECYFNLGHVRVKQNNPDQAVACYQQAIQLKPDMAQAYVSLARVQGKLGKVDEEIACLEQAVRLQPTAFARITLATRLPVIYQSVADLEASRDRLIRGIRQLREQQVVHDLTEETAVNVFYLAYQGLNDRDIMRELAGLHRAPQLVGRAFQPDFGGEVGLGSPTYKVDGNRRIRVGFVSSFFAGHTIGHLMRGLVAQLSRQTFEVTVLSIDRHEDEIAGFFKQHADRYLEVPRHLPTARRLIAEQQLDVLFYPDIGLDPETSTLAFSRLAPVQCTTWGHPVTTGIDTIDYFISSEALETEGAEEHYTETLVKLKKLPVYYYRPKLPAPLKTRADFGLAEGAHVYGCPQSLFKLHPEFDEVLGGILRGDSRGLLVLSLGLAPHWEQLLRQRFAATVPEVVDRIRFLPKLSRPEFLNLMALADVLLDPLHFGGGNTSYEGLAFGVPIVTLPTKLLRGRITFALYKQMQVLDCVARNPQDYIELALRLGTDNGFRETVRGRILAANGVLYENSEGVRELEQFFQRVSVR